MDKLKFKISWSVLILLLVCLITKNFLLMTSYIFALFLHEMSHYLVAKQKGYEMDCIVFSVFGMKLNLKTAIHPNDEFIITLAGPLCNVVLCVICTSLWWIVPESYFFLLDFFNANLVLCLFNLLPIEPLDGSKIFSSILSLKMKSRKARILKNIFSIILSVGCILFFMTLYDKFSVFMLIVTIFFVFNLFEKRNVDIDVATNFEASKEKKFYKTIVYYASGECTLLDLYKKINQNKYTIFVLNINGKQRFVGEEVLKKLLLVYHFKTQIKDCFC